MRLRRPTLTPMRIAKPYNVPVTFKRSYAYTQIYNEQLVDLLQDAASDAPLLRIREDTTIDSSSISSSSSATGGTPELQRRRSSLSLQGGDDNVISSSSSSGSRVFVSGLTEYRRV
jgi:hypothetical protein